ncbi:MAG: glycosyltransferase [Pseudanabaenaceae cyanobacterium bins.68]|nr:glycosyltransferase [Pseudanabaenaceae cyanobacterium bins.68]
MPHSPQPAVDPRLVLRPQTATLVMFGLVGICGLVVAAWFAGEGHIGRIFAQLQTFQDAPPTWLEVPIAASPVLVAWTILFTFLVYLITKVYPQPQTWSRFVVVAILIILIGRYVIWRTFSTLNLTDPWNGLFSLGLYLLEMLTVFNGLLQLFLLVQSRDRRPEADRLAEAVIAGEFCPTVDILIPTYNEPSFILRRTVIGCQALDYSAKTIYLLDDQNRPQVQALAAELGCEYLARPEHRHAKAGNLNYAIARTHGDLIVCFDADFIPTRNFLTRTVGFFQDQQIALVQTPQSFYSADPITRNLGLENILVPEQEVFYRQIQPVRDGTESVVCAGTSFVMRRQALQAAGGEFVTSSLSEDYFTSVRLSGQGYRLVYLDEKLSAGAAPDDMGSQATQRLRWARGTLQAFFIAENPLTIPGLSLMQRVAHFTGILHWFTSLSRVGFLLIPLAYSFLGIVAVQANMAEILFYFLPQYLVHLAVFGWLSDRSRSAFLSDIYDVVLCFPLALTVIQTLLNPFAKGFKVTPKGGQRDRYSFNWGLAAPLIGLFMLTAVSLWRNLGNCLMLSGGATHTKGLELGWIWSAYNLVLLSIALLVMLDLPKPDLYEWFELARTVRISYEQAGQTRVFWGRTSTISEVGAIAALTQAGLPIVSPSQPLTVNLQIVEDNIELTAQISHKHLINGFPTVRLEFAPPPLPQHRRLVEMLFCRPGQWRRQCAPGELASIWLLLRSLLAPRALFGRKIETLSVPSAIALTQG